MKNLLETFYNEEFNMGFGVPYSELKKEDKVTLSKTYGYQFYKSQKEMEKAAYAFYKLLSIFGSATKIIQEFTKSHLSKKQP